MGQIWARVKYISGKSMGKAWYMYGSTWAAAYGKLSSPQRFPRGKMFTGLDALELLKDCNLRKPILHKKG